MRDYVERYSNPPVHNLLTVRMASSRESPYVGTYRRPSRQFGSPHMGIASLIPCKSNLDVTCRLAREAAKRGVYGKWAQDKLIQVSDIS
jgi:palmitoyl-protein thioesterase